MRFTSLSSAIYAIIGLVVGLNTGAASAVPIAYNVDRTIHDITYGDGTVSGFIETDGTIGVLTAPNITDFQLTLASPNLKAPNPVTLSYGAANQYYLVTGTGLVATLTDITFDFSLPYGHNFFIYNYGSGHYYCVHTTECFTDSPGPAETMGAQVPLYIHSQREVRSGVVTIASVAAVSAVPLPAALPLFGTGLGIMGLVGWWRRRGTAAAI